METVGHSTKSVVIKYSLVTTWGNRARLKKGRESRKPCLSPAMDKGFFKMHRARSEKKIDGFQLGVVLVRSGVAPTVKNDMDRNQMQVRLEPNLTGTLVGFRNSRYSYLAK